MISPLLLRHGLKSPECVVVGDRLYTDIRMAVENNLGSILVLTGESKAIDVVDSPWKPSAVVESVGALIS